MTSSTVSRSNWTLCSPRLSSGLDTSRPVLIKSDISTSYLDLLPLHVLIRIDRFGFSANNVTYQALGEHPHFLYYDFHKPPTSKADVGQSISPLTHGLIPVWGFGTVIASAHPKISSGERVYGYFAPTRFLTIEISKNDVNKNAFYAFRPYLPPDRRPYNQIIRCAADPQYTPSTESEDLTMLYRPLFWTAYWCEDWVNSAGFYASASGVLISSASSKTAFTLAYCIGKRRSGEMGENSDGISRHCRIVGVTSPGNVPFTTGLGLYDQVVSYESLFTSANAALLNTSDTSLNINGVAKWIYMDVAGNDAFNTRLETHFQTQTQKAHNSRIEFVARVSLGLTNLQPSSSNANTLDWQSGSVAGLFPTASNGTLTSSPSRSPLFRQFFTPEWLRIRQRELSIPQILKMQDKAWSGLMIDGKSWVTIKRVNGAQSVKEALENWANQRSKPEEGFIWSLWDDSDNESDDGGGSEVGGSVLREVNEMGRKARSRL